MTSSSPHASVGRAVALPVRAAGRPSVKRCKKSKRQVVIAEIELVVYIYYNVYTTRGSFSSLDSNRVGRAPYCHRSSSSFTFIFLLRAHTHTYAYTRIHTDTYIHTDTHKYIYIYIYMCLYICIYIHIYRRRGVGSSSRAPCHGFCRGKRAPKSDSSVLFSSSSLFSSSLSLSSS